MALLDTLRNVRRTRALARELKGIRLQLTRIAEAMERAIPKTEPLQPKSVEITDVDLNFAAQMEAAETDFLQKRGRTPTTDELALHYEEIKHLL